MKIVPAIKRSMTEKMTKAWRIRPEHPPVHEDEGEGEDHHRQAVEEVGQTRRVLEGVGGVHAVEAAAVRPEHLHRLEGGDRADDDGLLVRLALVRRPHGRGLEGGDAIGAL